MARSRPHGSSHVCLRGSANRLVPPLLSPRKPPAPPRQERAGHRSPRDPNPYAGMNPVMIAVYISIPPPPISRPPRVPRGCTQQTITHTTKQVAISRARKGRARGRRAEPRRRAPRNRRAPPRSSIGWESRLVSSQALLPAGGFELELVLRFLSGGVVLWSLDFGGLFLNLGCSIFLFDQAASAV